MDYVPTVTPGGNALPFYAVLRVEMLTPKPHPSTPNAMVMRLKIVKTKIAKPIGKEVLEMAFEYGRGFNTNYDLLDTAKSMGVVVFKGKSIRLKLTDDGEGELLQNNTGLAGPGSGQAAFLQMVAEDPDLYKKINDRCQDLRARGIVFLGDEGDE